MKRSFALLAACLLLGGCASGHPLDCATGLVAWNDCAPGSAGYNKRISMQRGNQERCSGYGFQPGTDAYAQCLMNLDRDRDQANNALLNAVAGGFASRPIITPVPAPMPQASHPIMCTTTQIGATGTTLCQ
jgi:hypothetical protein